MVKLFKELRVLKTIIRLKIKLTNEELEYVREQSVMMVLDQPSNKVSKQK